MTKKHFIALADAIKTFNADETNTPMDGAVVSMLATFCAAQNPRFDRERWLGYVAGTNGPNGGKV